MHTSRLKSLAEELGIDQRVAFLGELDDAALAELAEIAPLLKLLGSYPAALD